MFSGGSLGRDSALSSVVEHYLHTVGVVGSKPTVRTIFNKIKPSVAFYSLENTGVMAEVITKCRGSKMTQMSGKKTLAPSIC